MVKDWDFVASRASFPYLKSRMAARILRTRPAPPHSILKAIVPFPRWSAYFIYAPDGVLASAHRFTLDRLRLLDRKLLVICAVDRPELVPEELFDSCSALYWKGLSGFDFSAYTLALRSLSRHSEHADVLVLNDSVFGPFGDISALVGRSRWDLTGFTASSEVENHIQSYAFHMRDVTVRKMRALRSVFLPALAFDAFRDVITCQETRLGRIAARCMTVGAMWYSQSKELPDSTLVAPLDLVRDGFPFIKRSLLGKHAAANDPQAISAALKALGHPDPQNDNTAAT